MGLIIQKYGGTSVGSVERIQAVAQRVKTTVEAGNALVVVVSAMGKTTDGLVKLANGLSSNPCSREMDMLLSTGEQVTISLLSMALQEIGQPAISLTGAQVGIVTEPAHTRARILNIDPQRLERHLKEGKVVVVAGFQGTSNNADRDVTTLGRGGSDTSAVALAAALRADCCEIYTDVPGILTTDPRLVEDAQLMDEITSDEMLELASLGAKVLHPRAVEIARNYGVQMVVRSSWTDEPGTRVISPIISARPLQDLELGRPVDAVHFDHDQAKVALLRVADRPGVAAGLFGELAHQGLDVDLIIQSIHEGNSNDIAFTVSKDTLKQAEAVSVAFNPPQGDNQAEVLVDRDVAKVGIVGAGIIGRPSVAAQMFQTLADAGINLQMISTSEVNVSCTVAMEDCDRAIQLLCRTFEVASSPVQTSLRTEQASPPVRGIALDLKQAQLAIRHVPDHPGMAAQIFQALAAKNISIDMVIQSQRSRPVEGVMTRDIAFTVGETDLQVAQHVLKDAADQLGCGPVTADSEVAKLSIVGIGMLGRPGVAAQMFQALAAEQINIQMIATSEIRVSCVIPLTDGVKALKAVHAAFDLGSPHH
ncbi:Aspartokinase [Acaryochloris thomasi RCC1774]|uniref:aspartate kinase n=1 Tax=Acaryochloris thomasi RCC1774 TaxID=1764569 RepID=A0A2W1JCA2_9CYAN|nr:aspartate kinase [Acaryochloris thomasi]PZD71599.1 Aspartokinase [Acaryochloris thomasi RCC1774]